MTRRSRKPRAASPAGRGGDAAGRGGRGGPAGRAETPWALPAFLLAAALLSLLFYREFVFHPGRVLFGTDMVIEGYPLRRFALEEIRAGRGLPLWNPFVYGGLPYLATLPGPIFYPTSLLYLFLPLGRAIGWTFVLHTFLAGAFGWFAARSFRLGPGASAVAGLAFMFCGYLVSTLYGGHDGRMFAIALVPLAFGAAERGLAGGRGVWFLLLAAGVALQIFTPHAQIVHFSSLGVVGWAAFRLAWLAREEGAGTAGRRAGWLVGAFALAALVGAVQLLPAASLLEHVGRAATEEGYAFASSWALPPQEASALLLPDLVGSLETYWGTHPFKLHTEYLGAVPAALALVGLAGLFGGGLERRERRVIGFLGLASLLGVLFALGGATPVHRLAYETVPLVDAFRAPSLMLGPVSFFVALLAGFGWERVRGAAGVFPWTAAWVAATPLLLLAAAAALAPAGLLRFAQEAWYGPTAGGRAPFQELAGPLRLGGLAWLAAWAGVLGAAWLRAGGRAREGWLLLPLLLLLVADLWRVDARYLRTVPTGALFGSDAVIETLRREGRPWERAWPLERSYEANELMYHGIPTVSGTQKFVFSWYEALVGGLGYENLLRRPALWELFDLRWLVLRSRQDVPRLRAVEGAEADGARLYEVTAEAPHAFFPEAVEEVAGPTAAIAATLELEDGASRAAVERAQVAAATPGGSRIPAGNGNASVTRWHPDEILLSVEAEREGLLFVSEVWAPGWRAYVDGAAAPVLRVNGAFRGVVVPAGGHEVRLAYRPASVRWGASLSALGLLILLVAPTIPAVRREGKGSS